jgi:hypothetical protein
MDLVTLLMWVFLPLSFNAVGKPSGQGASSAPSRQGGTRDASAHGRQHPQRRTEAMPAGSSKKRERQYEHIKESYKHRGVSTDEAEERAARTVNKERREHGETKSKRKS